MKIQDHNSYVSFGYTEFGDSQIGLSNWETFVTFFKIQVCTAVFYLPKNYYRGGYIFSPLCIIASLVISYTTQMKLIRVSDTIQNDSLHGIGQQVLGNSGKTFVFTCLFLMQYSFCVGMAFYLCSQVQDVLDYMLDFHMPMNYYALIFGAFLASLCLLRDLKRFAKYMFYGNCILFTCIGIILYFAVVNIQENGFGKKLQPINYETWPEMIGYSTFLFEGAGVSNFIILVLTVRKNAQNKLDFPKVFLWVYIALAAMYMIYAEVVYFAYGNQLTFPLITDNLPQTNSLVQIMILIFCVNLFITFPSQFIPVFEGIADMIQEKYDLEEKHLKIIDDSIRIILVFFTFGSAMLIRDQLNQFLSLIGSAICIPMVFTFPCILDYKIHSKTLYEKTFNIVIIAISIYLIYLSSMNSIQHW